MVEYSLKMVECKALQRIPGTGKAALHPEEGPNVTGDFVNSQLRPPRRGQPGSAITSIWTEHMDQRVLIISAFPEGYGLDRTRQPDWILSFYSHWATSVVNIRFPIDIFGPEVGRRTGRVELSRFCWTGGVLSRVCSRGVMAWRSLLAVSKRRNSNFCGSFEVQRLQRGSTIKTAGKEIGDIWRGGLWSIRSLTSSSTPLDSGNQSPVPLRLLRDIPAVEAPADILQIDDGEILYSGMTAKELLTTLFNLHLVAHEPLVDLFIKVLKSPLMKYGAFRVPILEAVKRTAYSHFCAGENVAEASATLQRMWELGLKGILDYSLEDATDNRSCDHNLQEFLKTIDTTLLLPPGSVSFACVKITALCPLKLLERVSDLLRWQHVQPGLNLPWKQESLPILAPSSPTYHTSSPPQPLSAAEETNLRLAERRLETLCRACEENSLPLLVDAEYTSVQPAIDYFTYSAFVQFNKCAKPVVYGTIQAYLKDALARLTAASEEATKRGVQMGLKLVRGAYITRESALAASLGAPSPIHSSIRDTHSCYDACASFMLEKAAMAEGSVVLATHNFDSGKVAAAKAEELGIKKGNDRLQFAQLKGMADSLSLGLAQAGFEVSKYLPFGPVGHVMPYLIRRAEENRGLLSTALADRQRISKELNRRLRAAISGV